MQTNCVSIREKEAINTNNNWLQGQYTEHSSRGNEKENVTEPGTLMK